MTGSTPTPNTAQTLTPEGKRLADALRQEAAFLIDRLREFENELLSEGQEKDWDGHVTPSISRLEAALLFTAPEGEGAGLREALEPFDKFADTSFPDESLCTIRVYARELRAVRAALASPQPAVEGPVAAGVGEDKTELLEGILAEALLHAEGWTADAIQQARVDNDEDWKSAVRRAFAVAALAAARSLEDPKPTVPGNDAGMREGGSLYGLQEADVVLHAAIQQHEDAMERAGAREGGAFERAFDRLCRFYGYGGPYRSKGTLEAAFALAPQTGSAGEDPKTPDAGVGDREALNRIANPILHMQRETPEGYRFDGQMARSLVTVEYLQGIARDALAQPAPVGEDETGVREAASHALVVLNDLRVEAITAGRPWTENSLANATLFKLAAAFNYPLPVDLAPQPPKAERLTSVSYDDPGHPGHFSDEPEAGGPPKAETPAGAREDVRAHVHGTPNGRGGFFNARTWSWQDTPPAALSAAPAARPGDGVERVRHVKSGGVYEVLGEAKGFQADEYGEEHPHSLVIYRRVGGNSLLWMLPSYFRDGRFVPAAAPAADEGRA